MFPIKAWPNLMTAWSYSVCRGGGVRGTLVDLNYPGMSVFIRMGLERNFWDINSPALYDQL